MNLNLNFYLNIGIKCGDNRKAVLRMSLTLQTQSYLATILCILWNDNTVRENLEDLILLLCKLQSHRLTCITHFFLDIARSKLTRCFHLHIISYIQHTHLSEPMCIICVYLCHIQHKSTCHRVVVCPWSHSMPARRRNQGLYSLRRHRLISIGIPIINLRRSSDRLRFIMGIPIPVRRRLLSE